MYSNRRLRPPVTATCDRNHVTSWSGRVSAYRRGPADTWLQVSTDEDTLEALTLVHAGKTDAIRHYLLWGAPFTPEDWVRIEADDGELQAGVRAVVWVCDDGRTAPVIDWQPRRE